MQPTSGKLLQAAHQCWIWVGDFSLVILHLVRTCWDVANQVKRNTTALALT